MGICGQVGTGHATNTMNATTFNPYNNNKNCSSKHNNKKPQRLKLIKRLKTRLKLSAPIQPPFGAVIFYEDRFPAIAKQGWKSSVRINAGKALLFQ
jgi:hypothetical protein